MNVDPLLKIAWQIAEIEARTLGFRTIFHSLFRILRAQALAGGFATLRRSPLRFEPSLCSPIRVHEAREVIAPLLAHRFAAALRAGGYAYADGADFDYTISRLAPIGEKMAILLA